MGVASFGFDSDANRIANEAKLVKGDGVYVYAALRALATWKPARFRVIVDGVRHEFTGCTVAVGNSKVYGGGMYVLPDAEIDDGRLDVMFVKDASKLRLLSAASAGLQGHARRLGARRVPPRRGDRGELRPPLRHLRRR